LPREQKHSVAQEQSHHSSGNLFLITYFGFTKVRGMCYHCSAMQLSYILPPLKVEFIVSRTEGMPECPFLYPYGYGRVAAASFAAEAAC
jgi:hypothetical protein